MAQIFYPGANTISRWSIGAGMLVLAALILCSFILNRSAYQTRVETPIEQPVPFSHRHHAGGLGIDCRYCHTSVETSAFAGIPSTETCMTCHSQIWRDSPMLASVRESYQNNIPIRWNKVYDTPNYVYFNHSIHVHKGVGCSTCHGRVDRMPLMWKAQSMQMEWCLACHRDPAPQLRPVAEVFNMEWTAPNNQIELGTELAKKYDVRSPADLTSCSTCHR